MIKDTLKEIAAAKSKLAELEKKKEAELRKKLVALHTDLGFDSRESLIDALQGLGGKKRGRKPAAKKAAAAKKGPQKAAKKSAKKGPKKRAKRTRITPELKSGVVADVKAGGKGTDIAKKFGISVPSLQNIKKEAGLIKPRKK